MNPGRLFFISFLLNVLLSIATYGQVNTDSLRVVIQTTLNDSSKAAAYNALANELAFTDPDSSEIVAKAQIQLTKSADLKYLHGKGFQNLALSFHIRGMLDSARKYYFKSLPIQQELLDSLGIAGLYNNIGVTFNQEGNLPKSLENYQKSLDLKLALGQLEASAKTLNNIGIIHFDQKDYKKAMRYYQQALDLEIENPAGSARTLGNIGLNFLEQDLYQDALDYYRKSFHIVDSIGAPCRALYAINGVGQAFSKLQQLDSAKHYLTEALNQARTCQDPVIQTSALLELGNIAFTESRLNNAKTYLLESEKIARSNKLMAHFKEASDALYQYYKETNDTKNALHYLETSFALRDSLFNEDLTKKLTTLELSYNFQKERDSLDYIQKAEILTYDARIKRQNLLQLITIGGLTVVMIVAFVIYRYYRLKNLANKELTVKNQQISEALEEREVLLQEVHHRVKNNLQVVSSLLNIQSKFLEDESAKKAILEGRDRVLSMALVHQRLYVHKNLSQIDIKEYLTQLSDTLFDSYRVGQDQVQLNKDIDNLDIDLDTSIHLGLIVNELISNSLKHAFQEGGQGQIELSLKEVGNEYQLSVSDNGSGVANEEQLLKSHGFRIVKSLVRGLDANLIVNIASGTFIMISFIQPIPVTQPNRD